MTTPTAAVPSVYDLLARELGAKLAFRFGEAATADIASKIIARNDPGRVALIIVNLSAATVRVRPLSPASATAGIVLTASGGSVAMNWRDDAILQALEWHAQASADTSAILVIEVIMIAAAG